MGYTIKRNWSNGDEPLTDAEVKRMFESVAKHRGQGAAYAAVNALMDMRARNAASTPDYTFKPK